jgi:hypothetical protein
MVSLRPKITPKLIGTLGISDLTEESPNLFGGLTVSYEVDVSSPSLVINTNFPTPRVSVGTNLGIDKQDGNFNVTAVFTEAVTGVNTDVRCQL